MLIHGAGGNTRDLDIAIVDELSSRFRVFLVDRPGHGWSDRLGPQFERLFGNSAESPIEQAHALAAAVEALGATDPIVVGHSFGGAVAMAWALERQSVATVTIAGGLLPWPGDIDASYRLFGSRLGGAIVAPIAAAFVPESYVRGVLEGVFRPNQGPSDYYTRGGVPLATRLETIRANNQQVRALRPFVVDQSERYDEITHPIEVLHGTEDKSVFLTVHAEPIAERLSNVNLTVLDGVGHSPHHVVPEQVIAAIDRAAERAGLR